MVARYWIEFNDGGRVRRVEVDGDELTIGRDETNDIVLDDRRASRLHCKLTVTGDGLVLEDCKSRNGTVFKGSMVNLSPIAVGDTFRVGDVTFTVGETHDAGAAADSGSQAVDPATADTLVEPGSRPEERCGTGVPEQKPSEPPQLAPDPIRLEPIEAVDSGVIEVSHFPFTVGRRTGNDLVLRDQRVSSRHAQFVYADGLYSVEDFNSRNGTFVDDLRSRSAVLTPGVMIRIGSARYRVEVPETPQLRQRLESLSTQRDFESQPVEENLGRIELDAFDGASRLEHPLVAVAVVCVLGALMFFAVDTARRVLVRQPIDPPESENLIGQAWSFEGGASEEASGADWELVEGDRGRFEIVEAMAQYPGRHALKLTSTAEAGRLTRVSPRALISVRAGQPYRLRGFVANLGCFASGVVVEWLERRGERDVVHKRSYSDIAQMRREELNLDQVVDAPSRVTHARVACFVAGGGAAVFDRIEFAAASDADAADDGGVPKFVFGPSDARQRVHLRRGYELQFVEQGLRSWFGLASQTAGDGYDIGMIPWRILDRDDGYMTMALRFADLSRSRWADTVGRLQAGQDGLHVRVQPADGDRADDGSEICLFIETPIHDLRIEFPEYGLVTTLNKDDPLPQRFHELTLGAGRRELVFASHNPLVVSKVDHPLRRRRQLLMIRLAEGRTFDISALVSSRLESVAIARQINSARRHYLEGRFGEAISRLKMLQQRFSSSESAGEIEAQIAIWETIADAAFERLRDDLEEMRAAPHERWYRTLTEGARAYAAAYRSAEFADRGDEILSAVEELWQEAEKKSRATLVDRYFDVGRKFFRAHRMSLARLALHHVKRYTNDETLRRQASGLLDGIDRIRTQESKGAR